jgi:hypothetical protein
VSQALPETLARLALLQQSRDQLALQVLQAQRGLRQLLLALPDRLALRAQLVPQVTSLDLQDRPVLQDQLDRLAVEVVALDQQVKRVLQVLQALPA